MDSPEVYPAWDNAGGGAGALTERTVGNSELIA